MVNIFSNTILIASNTTLYNAFKAAFMPVPAHLSCCCQHPVTVDIVGKVAQPYLYPGSYHANTAHNKIPRHHRLHPKHMLNARPCLCPGPVSLLLPLRQFVVFAALALQMLSKAQFFKPLYRLLGSIRRISIHITAAVVFIPGSEGGGAPYIYDTKIVTATAARLYRPPRQPCTAAQRPRHAHTFKRRRPPNPATIFHGTMAGHTRQSLCQWLYRNRRRSVHCHVNQSVRRDQRQCNLSLPKRLDPVLCLLYQHRRGRRPIDVDAAGQLDDVHRSRLTAKHDYARRVSGRPISAQHERHTSIVPFGFGGIEHSSHPGRCIRTLWAGHERPVGQPLQPGLLG